MYLALGVRFDEESGEIHTFSRETKSIGEPQAVSDMLLAEDGGSEAFEQILILRNGATSPDVVEHWNCGKEYD